LQERRFGVKQVKTRCGFCYGIENSLGDPSLEKGFPYLGHTSACICFPVEQGQQETVGREKVNRVR
jgi:hypothetical protein